MPNLKSLRSRINSVGSTRKITRAMQMVAASKLRRAQETILAARPYAQNMHQTIAALATQTPMGQLSPLARSFFDEKTERTKHLFIVMTTERGLCGGFNTQILRLLRSSAARIRGQGGGRTCDFVRRQKSARRAAARMGQRDHSNVSGQFAAFGFGA